METDRTPPEFKRLLDILKIGLRQIQAHCRHGLLAGDVPVIRRICRNIREAAGGLETLLGGIKEPPINKDGSNREMTYAPKNKKT
jgi:hypothetical protein